MMAQYLKTKEEYKDCILFYRLGDFYEMFYDDALLVSKELELTLTGKDCGLEERAPMCGVPYHAVEGYLARLVENGHRVAICEQVEDPSLAKGLVRREVVRIVTPGTIMSEESLEGALHNYIASVVYERDRFGLACADVSTGTFLACELDDRGSLFDELGKFAPREILIGESFALSGIDPARWESEFHSVITHLPERNTDDARCRRILTEHFASTGTEMPSFADAPSAEAAAGSLLLYLEETQMNALSHLLELKVYRASGFMILDQFTRRNLELTQTMRDKNRQGSLLWVLDKTRTAMGARLLRTSIEQPLLSAREIITRQKAVGELKEKSALRDELREYLSGIYDLERLIVRITYGTATPRDLTAFGRSIGMLPHVRTLLSGVESPLLCSLHDAIDPLEELRVMIEEAICDDPPVAMKDGGIIRDGYHEEVDRLRSAKTDGKNWLAKLEEEERERTGIKNLRVRYNKVFGYYLEVTNSYKDLVPDDYIRKQTLANAERYYVPRLKELEDTILGAEDRLRSLEYELFSEVRDACAAQVRRVKETAEAVAYLDMLASFAEVAFSNRYVCPVIDNSGIIRIREGRHPVIEKMPQTRLFVPNDTYLDEKEHRLSVITGPNMAGKSTYMRQTALIVLMAQIGSFVPADEAQIGLVDRIFTRVGASDDLASGQSTFMVEMTEMASILKNATPKSLLILDEIGRGTSTFDGLSIAWAVVEYISDPKKLGARTLFATHYHELTELEGKVDGVNNYCIAVREDGEDIVFLRKIVPGGADRSYGIQVARLAGVPEAVLARAREISESLSGADITANMETLLADARQEKKPVKKARKEEYDSQLSLFDAVPDEDILATIRGYDIGRMTPLDALTELDRLQKMLVNRWKQQSEDR